MLGIRVVSVLDSGAEEPGFKSQSRRCRVTVLGKLFTPIHQAAKLVAALSRVARVTAGLAECNGSLYTVGFMTHVTCRLTAKDGDQLRNPTLGNRVWATFIMRVRLYRNGSSTSGRVCNCRTRPFRAAMSHVAGRVRRLVVPGRSARRHQGDLQRPRRRHQRLQALRAVLAAEGRRGRLQRRHRQRQSERRRPVYLRQRRRLRGLLHHTTQRFG